MATHPSILAWDNPMDREPGGLQSMGSQRVGHGSVCTHIHIKRASSDSSSSLRVPTFSPRQEDTLPWTLHSKGHVLTLPIRGKT